MLQLNWLWLVIHSWAPVCVYVYLQNRPPAVQGSQHQSQSPACMNPALMNSPWVRQKDRGRAVPNPHCLSRTDVLHYVMSSFYTFSVLFSAQLWMQSKLFRTSLSRLEHVSTSALLYHCVCMRLLTENVNLHHASWFQSFSVLQIMNYGSFLACSSHRAQTSLAEGHVLNCVCLQHCAHSGLWVFFLPFLISFSLLSSVSPFLPLTFPVYSTGIRMKIPLLWNTTSRGSPMKSERRSWCMCRRRTFQKSRMCTAMFPTLTFHRLR